MNTYYYFTYGNIHKVALLGIFGAILGYGGVYPDERIEREKKQQELTESYPEFYEKLRTPQLSILPKKENGCISKRFRYLIIRLDMHQKEQGGNLVVKNSGWKIRSGKYVF